MQRRQASNPSGRKADTGLAGRSVHYIARTMSAIFNQAIEDGIIAANPAARPGRYVKIDDRRGKFGFLAPAEGRLFLETAKEHTPKFYLIFLTALRTGMRQGEILGLQWGDIDWNGKFIEIRRASWLIANGESLVYVKEQLGHHSIQITVDTYGHLIPGANRKEVNALDDPGWNTDMQTHPETSILRVISE